MAYYGEQASSFWVYRLLYGSDNFSHARTTEGFDPNAYTLMEKAGYDFENLTTLGKVVESKPHSLNETQRKIQEQGGSVGISKVGLGFIPSQPIRISGRRKGKQSAVKHISAKELDEGDEKNAQENPKSFVFDRL